ncbi:MAG: tripartite tricarboxylate transporter substrate binding protein [Betaproteobacteria bacterium]|nr:tripartite tricarboxylate transporter substrate binding protein [Betaproteobacteria bacterium]
MSKAPVMRGWLCIALLVVAGGAPNAQTFPSKPVRLVVPFPAGGTTDVVARIVAQRLSENLGRQFIVENRAGAYGVIGFDAVAKSAPDGYTLIAGSMGNFTANPSLYRLPFDIQRDFVPVTQLVSLEHVLVVHPSVRANTLGELIALAKTTPLNFSSSGSGGAPHLAGELFNRLAGVKMMHIPYKGSAPSYTDLAGGQVQLSFDTMAMALPYVKAGKLRAIAVLGKQRSVLMPELPAAVETLPGFEVTNWIGVAAPAHTPQAIVDKLQTEFALAVRATDISARLHALGAEALGNSPNAFAAVIRSDTARWSKVIKDAGIRAE